MYVAVEIITKWILNSVFLISKNWFLESRLGLYLIIGGTAAAIDVVIFILLYEFLGFSAISSHSVSIPLAGIFSFAMNATLNFRKTDKILFRAFSFATIVFLGYLLGVLIIWIVEGVLGINGTIGKLVSLPFVFFFQYYLNSKFSFGE